MRTKRLLYLASAAAVAAALYLAASMGNLGAQQTKGATVKVDRKSTRLNSSHSGESRMPSSA